MSSTVRPSVRCLAKAVTLLRIERFKFKMSHVGTSGLRVESHINVPTSNVKVTLGAHIHVKAKHWRILKITHICFAYQDDVLPLKLTSISQMSCSQFAIYFFSKCTYVHTCVRTINILCIGTCFKKFQLSSASSRRVTPNNHFHKSNLRLVILRVTKCLYRYAHIHVRIVIILWIEEFLNTTCWAHQDDISRRTTFLPF